MSVRIITYRLNGPDDRVDGLVSINRMPGHLADVIFQLPGEYRRRGIGRIVRSRFKAFLQLR